MSSTKGYPSSLKSDNTAMQHATVEPVRRFQNALSVIAHQFVQEIGTDATEAGTTTVSLKATAHLAQTGDVILISGREIKVEKTTANDIFLVEPLASIPSNGTSFTISRHKYPKVNASGEISTTATIESAPIQFVQNGVDTTVLEDTVTPANSKPLPVKDTATLAALLAMSAKLPSTLGQKTKSASMSVVLASDQDPLEVEQQALTAATDAVASYQGGTWDVGVNNFPTSFNVGNFPATQPVSAASLPLPAGAATETTLAALSTKVTKCNTDTVTISAALPAGTNNIGDVDVLSLPSLPAGSNLIGKVDSALDVVDLMDTPLMVGTSLPSSAASTLEVVATLAAAVKKIFVNDTIGVFTGLYVGAGNGTLKCIIGPGLSREIDCSIAAGSRVSIRNMAAETITDADTRLCIQFLG